MPYVEVIHKVPEEVTFLTKKIATSIWRNADKATVFHVGDFHVVVKGSGVGHTISIYDFNTSERPMASCMTFIRYVYTYASKGFLEKRLTIDVILDTLRRLSELTQSDAI
jgi:hypothetical protein